MHARALYSGIALGAAFVLILFVAPVRPDSPARSEAARLESSRSAAALDSSVPISKALSYLHTKQLANGGIEAFVPGPADEFTTIKAVMAVAAAGRPASSLTSSSGATPLDYLADRAITYTHAATGTGQLFPGRAGMLAVAVVAGDRNPRSFGRMDLVGELSLTYHAATGAYSTTVREGFSSGEAGTINQLWSILGLAAAQEVVPAAATDFLLFLQEADGGWGFGFGGDVDTTALVVQSLIASGNITPVHPKLQAGLDFLRGAQASTGGWASFGSLSADSTASAIQAIAAAGYVPVTASWATRSGRTPRDELVDLQASDGSFGSNALSTVHAMAGLAEAPLPIPGRQQRARLALTWMVTQQNADGSWSGFSGPDVGATSDAALAFAAAGFDPDTVRNGAGNPSALAFMASNARAFAEKSPDSAGKLALAVAAGGKDPHNFGGVNLVDVLNTKHYSLTVGAFGDPTNSYYQAFAILGLAAARESIPVTTAQTLIGLQQADGGWKYDLSPGDFNTTTPDNTGLAMEALIAAGIAPTSTTIANARSYLRAQQDSAGGWSNANSTAYAMQGLLAAGENLVSGWSKGGHSPYDALASYQKRDGPFVYAWSFPSDNGLATGQAVPSLLGVRYPLSATAALTTFVGVNRGADPDRTVGASPRGAAEATSVTVIVPFGSDVNADGQITVTWRLNDGLVQPLATQRADGYYTATIPGRQMGYYTIRATFGDPDGVQGPTELSMTVTTTWKASLPVILDSLAQ